METRGRYIVIGAFTVLGFLGILGFLLWFGAAQATRQFAYYDVLFDNVSGITRSAEVRFAGGRRGAALGLADVSHLRPLGRERHAQLKVLGTVILLVPAV